MTDCSGPPPPQLVQGVDEFNRGAYFACHETLEELWKHERAPVRDLYQGIIQLAVGYYHLQRGNYRGAVLSLERGLRRLRPFRPVCQSVRVDELVQAGKRSLHALRELGARRVREFDWRLAPQVKMRAGTEA